MMSSIMNNAAAKIALFNKEGQHYNLVAQEIYRLRREIEDPFSESYLPYIIAGLAAFDMGRMMGYSRNNGNFVVRLSKKLEQLKPVIGLLVNCSLVSMNLQQVKSEIVQAYEELRITGPGALHSNQAKSFWVGASKVLHFLNPELFIIIDSNAARAFKTAHNITFRKNAPQGYSASRYYECMKLAQTDILGFNSDKFQALESDTPITRIYDKLTFVTGSDK